MANVGSIEYTVSVETQQSIDAARGFDASMDSVQRSAKKTDAEMGKLGTSMTKLAASIGAVVSATAMLNEFKKAVNVTREFNVTVSRLSALTGMVGPELENLAQQAREIGSVSTLSASQAAAAMQLIGSRAPQLLESAEALGKVTQAAVVLAEAAGVDMVTAAGIMTSTMNQFNMSAEESDRIINTLAAGARNGAADVSSISAALARAGTQADISGVSIEEFTGLVQALAKGEITASDAGTALRNTLLILDTAADKNLRPSIVGISKALENLEKAQKNGLDMLDMFGRQNITAANILIRNRQEYERVTEAVTDTTEAYGQQAKNVNNLEGDLKGLSSAYEELQLVIGQLADDQLRSLTQNLTQLLLYIGESEGGVTRFEAALSMAGTAAASVAAIIAGRMVAAITAYTTATGTAILAERARLLSQKNLAAEEARRAIQEQEAAQRALANAANDTLRARAIDQLAAANQRVAAATAAATAANTAYTRSATLAGVAARGLGAAMAFLGGPTGVILIAAAALSTWHRRVQNARNSTLELSSSVKGLTAEMRELEKLENAKRIEEETRSLERQNKTLERNARLQPHADRGEAATKAFEEEMLRRRVAIQKTEARIEALMKRQQQLANANIPRPSGSSGGGTPSPAEGESAPASTTSQAGQDAIKTLEDQLAATKLLGAARARLTALQKLGADATDEEREEVARLVTEIYKLDEAQKASTKAAEDSAAAAKKAAEERTDGIEQNADTIAALEEQMRQAEMSAGELAQRQAELSLNEYATPQQIARVKELGAALRENAEEEEREKMQQAAVAADPRTEAANQYAEQLAAYQQYKEQELLTDLQYNELKNAAATEYEQARLAAQEEMFRAQSAGNEFLMGSIDALGAASTNVISGLLSGTMNTKEAMQALGNAIFQHAVGALVEMGVQHVKNMIMGQTAQTAAMATAAATGSAMATAYTPAAIAASIASFGGAATAGTAAMATAVPTMAGMIALSGARRHGGPVSPSSMYRVNEGGRPEVFQNNMGQQYMIPNERGKVVSNRDAQGGGGSGGTIVNVYEAENTRADVTTSQNDQGQDVIDIVVQNLLSDGAIAGAVGRVTGTQFQGS